VEIFLFAFEQSISHLVPFMILMVLLPAVVMKGMYALAQILGPAGFQLGSRAYLLGETVSGMEGYYKAAIVGLLGVGFIAIPILLCGILLQSFYFARLVARVGQEPRRRLKLKELFALDWSIIRFGVLLVLLLITTFVVFGIIESVTSPLPDRLAGLSAYFLGFFQFSFIACSIFAFFEPLSPGVLASITRAAVLVTKDWVRWLAMAIVVGVLVTVMGKLEGFFDALSDSSGYLSWFLELLGLFLGWYIAVVINRCYHHSAESVPE